MSGRHRTPTTNLCLTRAGALGLMLAAPLAVPGPAMAAQPSGVGLAPEESPPDDDTGDYLDHYRDQRRDAREQDRERGRNESSEDRDDEDRPRYRGSVDDRDGSSTRRSRAREAAARSRDQETDITSSRDDDSQGEDGRWDELAECESSQNWDADTGNGYRGGLQFSQSTWREHGGRRYAPSPDQASREQQIEVAKNVQREQGWSAWPSCSEKLGYT